MELVMEMDMNLGGIMVKISRMDFFMVADNVHSYSYRLFPDLAAKNTFRIAGKDFRIAGKEDMTLI